MDQHPAAWIFDIQGHAVHDGPGCRTLVFMSGCSLRCLWCANPEGQLMQQRLLYRERHCADYCDRCLGACPERAIRLATDGRGPRLLFERRICDRCRHFECTAACYHQALRVCGQHTTVDELMQVLRRDRAFWGAEGGVTFTGGEPLMQPEFLLAALRSCRQAWMHTAMETCAHVPTAHLLAVLPYLEWLLIDIKHMDPEQHRRATGQDNGLILGNLREVVGSGWAGRLILRMPLVPGFNDRPDNLAAILDLMRELRLMELEVLPLHRLGQTKYEQLSMDSPFADLSPPSGEAVEEVRRYFTERGVNCYCAADRPW